MNRGILALICQKLKITPGIILSAIVDYLASVGLDEDKEMMIDSYRA